MSTRSRVPTSVPGQMAGKQCIVPPGATCVWIIPNKLVTAQELYESASYMTLRTEPKGDPLNVLMARHLLSFPFGFPLAPEHKFVSWFNGNPRGAAGIQSISYVFDA